MERVKEILETYFEHTNDEMWEGYAWDGCHKIYLLDAPSAARNRELGYDVVLFRDVETAVNELAEWFESSCSLRFIDAIRGGGDDSRDYEDIIYQFQIEEQECSPSMELVPKDGTGRKDSSMATKTKTYDPSAVFAEAHKAGMEALNSKVPTPMVVSDDPQYTNTRNVYFVSEGLCGFASIRGIRANSRMGKWLVESGHGSKSGWQPGVYVWVREGGQSYERKSAYAYAFSGVLDKYGIKNYVESRLD